MAIQLYESGEEAVSTQGCMQVLTSPLAQMTAGARPGSLQCQAALPGGAKQVGTPPRKSHCCSFTVGDEGAFDEPACSHPALLGCGSCHRSLPGFRASEPGLVLLLALCYKC
jgi:hypothetical protein